MMYSAPRIDFKLANSVDPDEMQHYAAFHLGLHCCQRTSLWVSSIQRIKQAATISAHIQKIDANLILDI